MPQPYSALLSLPSNWSTPLTQLPLAGPHAQAYHATEDTELGKPRQVLADPSYIAGPWNLFWSQNAPQFLRFKVGRSYVCCCWLAGQQGGLPSAASL